MGNVSLKWQNTWNSENWRSCETVWPRRRRPSETHLRLFSLNFKAGPVWVRQRPRWWPRAGETSDSGRPSRVQSSHTASLPITLTALQLCSIIGCRRVKKTEFFFCPPWPDSRLRASPPWNEILHDTRRFATNSSSPCRPPDCIQSVWDPPTSTRWWMSSFHLNYKLFCTWNTEL